MKSNIPYLKKNNILLKGDKGKQIGRREVLAINDGLIKGILPLKIEDDGKRFQIYVSIEGYIKLETYLKTALNKTAFINLISDVIETMHALEQNYFNFRWLVLDMDFVYFNPVTRRIMFVYLPIQGYECSIPLRDFFLKILDMAYFPPGEDNSVVQDYLKILHSGVQFSIYDMDKFVSRNQKETAEITEEKIICPRCHAKVKNNLRQCTYCGKVLGSTLEQDEKPRIQYGNSLPPVSCMLMRESTGDKIPVNSFPFVVGKSIDCNLRLSENSAISRHHAQILSEFGRFYLEDLKSLNGTSLEGRLLAPNNPQEIKSGMTVSVANETFIFWVGQMI